MKKLIVVAIALVVLLTALAPAQAQVLPHPRVWINSTVLARMQAARTANSAEWQALQSYCDSHLGQNIGGGYQLLDWYAAVMNYSLAYRVSGNASYGTEGVKYLTALLRDRYVIGDALGGATAITIDSGYVARDIGTGVAVGRDWLHGHSGLTTSLINECGTRLNDWITWYNSNGYARNDPTDNYYAGYFTMVYTASIALEGDSGYQSSWQTQAETMWSTQVQPFMQTGAGAGGNWLQGWNYGPWSAREYLGYPYALETGTTRDNHWDETTWAADLVKDQIHMLYPYRGFIDDAGCWSGNFKGDPRRSVCQMCTVMTPNSATIKGLAKWFTTHLTWEPGGTGMLQWEALMYTDSSVTEVAPTVSNMGGLSYLVYGHGVARSADWTNLNATWVGVEGEPIDHQGESGIHTGEVKIGSRGHILLIDGRTYEYMSDLASVPDITGSHLYAPLQGWWHDAVTYNMDNVDSAYAYFKVDNMQGCYGNNDGTLPDVSYMRRDTAFLRPDFVAVLDTINTVSTSNLITEKWYTAGQPTINGATASITLGSAKLFTNTVNPTVSVTSAANSGSRTPGYNPNEGFSGVYKVLVSPSSPTTSNSILTLFETADSTQGSMTAYDKLTPTGFLGVSIKHATNPRLVLFATGQSPHATSCSFTFTPVASPTKCLVLGMQASTNFSVTVTGTTSKTVTIATGSGYTSTSNGALSFDVTTGPSPLTITTLSLPADTVGIAYSQTLQASGGTTPYTWAISSGTLPTGLSLNTSTGAITGTPTASGTSNFTARVTDNVAATATKALSIVVNAALSITTSSLPNGTVGTSYNQTLAATGGTTPRTWSLQSGSLPAGLSLVAGTGVISGTPTASGTSNFTAKVTDSVNASATRALSIAVAAGALSITTSSLPSGTVGSAYNQTLTAVGGTTPYTWAISSGSLPSGLSLSASSGAITGTPSASGTSNFTARVTDNASATATKALSIVVNNAGSGNTYYVATNGLDTNPGSSSQPWLTLQHAVDAIAAGDTIIVRSGTFSGCRIDTNSGTSGAVKTIKSETTGGAVLTSPGASNSHNSVFEVEDSNYWVIENFRANAMDSYDHAIDVRNSDHITVRNVEGHSSTITGIFSGFADYMSVENCEAHETTEHGIYMSNSADYGTVRGNTSWGNTECGIQLNADLSMGGDGTMSYWTLEKNTLYNNNSVGGAGINFDGDSDNKILNCLLYNNGRNGIALYAIDGANGASRNLIYNNTITMPSTAQWCVNIAAADQGTNPVDNKIKNCILMGNSTTRGSIIGYSSSMGAGFQSDYNAVVDRFSVDQVNETIISLATWRGYGFDAHSFITTDSALFVTPGSDFHLKAGSPAINAGTTLTEVTDDMDGTARPQGGVYDVGCYEAAGGSALTITTSSLPSGTLGTAYNQTLTATGGTTPYTWAISSGSLPAGLSLVASTGAITGTPTASGTSNFTARVTDNVAATATKALSIVVTGSALTITTASLPAGTVGSAYNQTLTATGGTTPYTWAISSGSLPAGLTLNTSSGAITGTPTATGTSNFTARVTDNVAATATKALSIVINAASGGATYQQTASDSETSTTSTAWQTKATLTFTPTASDTWLIFAFAEYKASGTSYVANVRLTVDATEEGAASMMVQNANEYYSFAVSKVATLSAAAHTLVIGYNTSNAAQTTYIRRARIVAIRKATLEMYSNAADSTVGLNTTQTDFAPVTFTPATSGDYLLIFTAESMGQWSNRTNIQAKLNSTIIDEGNLASRADANYDSFASFCVATLPASSQTAKFTAYSDGAGIYNARRFRVTAVRLTGGCFTDYSSMAADTQTGTTSTTFVEKLTKTWTSGSTGNWLVLASARFQGTAGQSAEMQVQYNNATTLALPMRTFQGSNEWKNENCVAVQNITGGSRQMDIDYRSTNASYTANIKYAHEVMLPLDSGGTTLSITTASLPADTVGISYNQTLTATGGTTPYTWAISSGSLPTGLTLVAGTGAITGTPTAAGTSNFTARVTDNVAATATKALSIVINAAPSISTSSLPGGAVGTAYNQTMAATGGTAPLTWSISSGSLPTGLSLVASTGAITGTPTASGTSSFTARVTDNVGATATKALSIVVTATLTITTASLPADTVGVAYNQTLAASGGATPYTWAIASGSLPAGLSLNTSTGAITGTPTTAGTSNFTARVTDNAAATATKALSIVINAAITITTSSLPADTVGIAYNQTLAATGGTGTRTWAISSGSLPAGLSLNSSTGAITGTPTTSGTSSFTARATDTVGATGTKALSIAINAVPSITTSSLPSGTQGAAYNQTLAASGGTTPLTWAISSGTLPTGLSLGASTGAITGTPTATGTSNFTVRVTDTPGATATKALSIVVVSGSDPTYRYTSSDTEASTTSTAFQTKATLSFTSAAADDWIILAFAEVKESNTSYRVEAQMVVDGTIEGLEVFAPQDTTDYASFSAAKFKNLSAASHTITLQYRSSSASGTARIRNARIVALRKALIAFYQAANDATTALTTTMSDITTLTFTPATANDYLFIWAAEVNANTAYSTSVECLYDGTSYDDGIIEVMNNANYMTFMSFGMFTPDAAAHTAKLRAAKETGSTATHNIRRSRVMAIQLTGGRFEGYWGQSSDSEATTTSTAWVEKKSVTWTTGNDGNWLLLNSARIAGTSTSYSTEARVQVNDSTTSAQQLREPKDTTDYMNFTSIDVRNLTTPRDSDTDYRSENAAATAKINTCRMYQLPLD